MFLAVVHFLLVMSAWQQLLQLMVYLGYVGATPLGELVGKDPGRKKDSLGSWEYRHGQRVGKRLLDKDNVY